MSHPELAPPYESPPGGWARPPGSRKWHYLLAGWAHSACGRLWGYQGERLAEKGEGEPCKACAKYDAQFRAAS